jgi:hypothetical protein
MLRFAANLGVGSNTRVWRGFHYFLGLEDGGLHFLGWALEELGPTLVVVLCPRLIGLRSAFLAAAAETLERVSAGR